MDIKFTMVMDEELARKMSYIGNIMGDPGLKKLNGPVSNMFRTLKKISIKYAFPNKNRPRRPLGGGGGFLIVVFLGVRDSPQYNQTRCLQ